ncbi:MAG: hypothetical protein ACR2JB_29835, partial [Bryobacteraceae bacterium]
MKVSTGLTRARRSAAALALDPIPASKVLSDPLEFAEFDKHNSNRPRGGAPAMTPRLRKLNLTAHIALSVGWIGAAAAFLVLSVAGLTSQDAAVMRGAYVSMNLICLYSIVPLSFAALGTGLIQSLGTQWGLFRYNWVLAKFLLTILSVAVLLMHQFMAMAKAANLVSEAAAGALPRAELGGLGFVLLRASSLGILVLLVITILSVYKPWGLTRYGWRKQQERQFDVTALPQRGGLKTMAVPSHGVFRKLKTLIIVGIGVFVVVMLIVMHLTGHNFRHGH